MSDIDFSENAVVSGLCKVAPLVLNSEARELEDRIAANVAMLLEGTS